MREWIDKGGYIVEVTNNKQKIHDLQVQVYQINELIKQLSTLSNNKMNEITELINK